MRLVIILTGVLLAGCEHDNRTTCGYMYQAMSAQLATFHKGQTTEGDVEATLGTGQKTSFGLLYSITVGDVYCGSDIILFQNEVYQGWVEAKAIR